MKLSPYLKFTFILLLLLGCSTKNPPVLERVNAQKSLMGTYVRIDVCIEEEKKTQVPFVFNSVWHRLEQIAFDMNVYDSGSDVDRINQSQGEVIQIREDTYFVIDKAKKFNELTQGAFDITIWPLVKTWKEAAKEQKIPSKEKIDAVRKITGSQMIKLLDQQQIQLAHPRIKVDLGGIAKGYAIDEAARILREGGFNQFLIDAGGDVYAGGRNCKGKPWRIGIRNPNDVNEITQVVKIENKSVTTSGNYFQYVEIEGKRWSHIINPVTGYPQEQIVSATVIAPTAIDADALSTAITILGTEKGLKLIDDLGKEYASMTLIPSEDQSFEKSMSKYFRKYKAKH